MLEHQKFKIVIMLCLLFYLIWDLSYSILLFMKSRILPRPRRCHVFLASKRFYWNLI